MDNTCASCGDELNTLDRDPNGDPNATCARCRAEEDHDFDAEPFAAFSRSGDRLEAASEYVAKHAKLHRGVYSVVLPNGRTVKARDTHTLMRKAVEAAGKAIAAKA